MFVITVWKIKQKKKIKRRRSPFLMNWPIKLFSSVFFLLRILHQNRRWKKKSCYFCTTINKCIHFHVTNPICNKFTRNSFLRISFCYGIVYVYVSVFRCVVDMFTKIYINFHLFFSSFSSFNIATNMHWDKFISFGVIFIPNKYMLPLLVSVLSSCFAPFFACEYRRFKNKMKNQIKTKNQEKSAIWIKCLLQSKRVSKFYGDLYRFVQKIITNVEITCVQSKTSNNFHIHSSATRTNTDDDDDYCGPFPIQPLTFLCFREENKI